MLLKTSCKTIIFPLKKLKLYKKINKVNSKTLTDHPLLLDFNQHITSISGNFLKLLPNNPSIHYFYRTYTKIRIP